MTADQHIGGDAKPDFRKIDGLGEFPAALRGGVVAIGNFDGVHRGHQTVLNAALALGHAGHKPVYAMTFEPHPRTVFAPDKPVFRLTPPDVKALIVRALGLDALLTVPFTREFAGLSAANFVSDILIGTLGIAHAVTGYDFHFGARRAGSPAFLQQSGTESGFGVTVVEAFSSENAEAISSSRIRAALRQGDVAEAAGLLGYRWVVAGKVVHGEKRGRELGFPTANIRLDPTCELRHGIYAVRMQVDGRDLEGVANYGRRPTFDDGPPLLEVFAFDFSEQIYDKVVAVSFVSFLRPEEKFDSVEALIAQMDRDCVEARASLAAAGPGSAFDREIAAGASRLTA